MTKPIGFAALLAGVLAHTGCGSRESDTADDQTSVDDSSPSQCGTTGGDDTGSTDTSGTLPFPDVCNGSDEIRLYFGDWLGGASDVAVDYMMYAEGMRYIKIDGHCHFYVYEGEAVDFRWWEPVREGDLTEDELVDVLTRLAVNRWANFDAADLSPSGYYPEWQRFEVAGESYECPGGCAIGGDAREVVEAARELIAELASETTTYAEPAMIEVSVVEWQNPGPLPVTMEWNADIPLADLVDDPIEAYLSDDPVAFMGTMLAPADAAWFLDAREAYLQGTPKAAPSAIGILEEGASEASYLLYIRSVVP